MASTLAAIAAAPFFGWELWVVALIGATVYAGVELASGQLRLHQLGRGISWDLIPFVFSLFLILRGVSHSGLAEWAQALLVQPGAGGSADIVGSAGAGGSFMRLLTVAATTALGSNLINNLPMLLVALDSLAAPIAAGEVGLGTVYAALTGTNLGPNFPPTARSPAEARRRRPIARADDCGGVPAVPAGLI